MRTQGGKNNTPYVQVGIVVSPEPLTIKLGDLQIGKDNLLVADYLLPDYVRKYTADGNLKATKSGSLGTTSATTVGSYGSHTHNVASITLDTDNTQSGDFTFSDGLATDDIVALISTLDEQTYIVLARVVSA